MDPRRLATLRSVVATFVPVDAHVERVTEYAARAIDGLTPRRDGSSTAPRSALAADESQDDRRADFLKILSNSSVEKLRAGFAALKRLGLFLAYAESERGSESDLEAHRYPGPRDDARASSTPLPLEIARDDERVRADVAIIGSGAGGGVVASVFARRGKRVVVLEAGGAYDAPDFTQRELMTSELYLDQGLTSSAISESRSWPAARSGAGQPSTGARRCVFPTGSRRSGARSAASPILERSSNRTIWRSKHASRFNQQLCITPTIR